MGQVMAILSDLPILIQNDKRYMAGAAIVVIAIIFFAYKSLNQASCMVQLARMAQAAGASEAFVDGLYSKAEALDHKGDGSMFNMAKDYKVYDKKSGKYVSDDSYKYVGKKGNEVFSSLFVDVAEAPVPEDETVKQTLVNQAATMTSMHKMRQSSLLM